MKKIKIAIADAMFTLTLLLMNIGTTGRANHEVLGISLALLIILHLILNFKWIKQISQNLKKINRRTNILYAVDICTFTIYLSTIILGLTAKSNTSLSLMLSHYICGRLAIIAMLIHLGFHIAPLINKITMNDKIKKIVYIVYSILIVFTSIILFYTLTKTYLWSSIIERAL